MQSYLAEVTKKIESLQDAIDRDKAIDDEKVSMLACKIIAFAETASDWHG